MIYVISLDDSQVVKIGHGNDPTKRVTQLQIGSPTPLVLQWVHEGDDKLENHLHAVFQEYRIRGEWFDLTPLGNAVNAVQEAVKEAVQSGLLKAARFRGPVVVHPGASLPAVPASSQTADGTWDARFPPSKRHVSSRPVPKPGCIRAWKDECLRPAGMTCGC